MLLDTETSLHDGHVEMPNGCHLWWTTNAAGGRTYWSDEIGGGVHVWDSALVDEGTLCFAIAIELALQRFEAMKTARELPQHVCGARGFADSGDACQACEATK